MPICLWLRKRHAGTSLLPRGGIPLLTSVSLRITASETIPSITPIYSNRRSHQLTPTRAAPSARAHAAPSPMSSSETQRRNQHPTDTISLVSMRAPDTGPRARHSVSAGVPMRKITSSTDQMRMRSFIHRRTHLPSMKVLIFLFSEGSSRRKQAQIHCLRKTEDVFR